MPIRTAVALPVTDDQRSELERMARSTGLARRKVGQEQALLLAADGVANEEIARRFGVDSDTVRRWRKRFGEEGTTGVGVIGKGGGRKPSLAAGTVERVVRATQQE